MLTSEKVTVEAVVVVVVVAVVVSVVVTVVDSVVAAVVVVVDSAVVTVVDSVVAVVSYWSVDEAVADDQAAVVLLVVCSSLSTLSWNTNSQAVSLAVVVAADVVHQAVVVVDAVASQDSEASLTLSLLSLTSTPVSSSPRARSTCSSPETWFPVNPFTAKRESASLPPTLRPVRRRRSSTVFGTLSGPSLLLVSLVVLTTFT
jgi:hypothetical protein